MNCTKRIVSASLAFKVRGTKKTFPGLLLAAALAAPFQCLEAAGPAPVILGSTAQFTILSESGITTAGQAYEINGNVGTSPAAGSYEIDLVPAQVNGIIYEVSAGGPAGATVDPTRLTTAIGDMTTAYNDAAGRTSTPAAPVILNPGSAGNVGGLTLAPGLYKFSTSPASVTGANLTLSGGPNDVWIFQVAAGLTVDSSIILAGGAQAGNVFWQVGTSAAIGTGVAFNGTIIAAAAVTMDTTSTLTGRALAGTAVTFGGSTVTVPTPEFPGQVSLQVTIMPSNAVVAGAQWEVDGGSNQDSGVTLSNLSAGSHTVVFTPTPGWITPANETFSITNGGSAVTNGIYALTGTAAAGALSVNLLPTEAVSVGAQWQVDGGSNQASGAMVTNLSPGNHTLSFSTVSGWITPANQTVIIAGNVVTTNTGVYSVPGAPGSLNVTLLPAAAVSAGALWQLNGGTNQISGATIANLAAGNYTVAFTPIAGWITPHSLAVTITNGGATAVTGTYILGTAVISLSGNLAFGGVATDTSSNQTLTISNGGNSPLVVVGISYPAGFAGSNLSGSIAPNSASSLVVTFSPTAATNYDGSLIVISEATSGTGLIPVSGFGSNDTLLMNIDTSGDGTVSPNLNNKHLTPGDTYTIKAVAGPGYQFLDWVGTTNSTENPLTFTFEPGFLLQANFISPFVGTYDGLFAATNGILEQTGMLKGLTVNAKGAYSASLLINGGIYNFNSSFDADGQTSKTITRTDKLGGDLAVTMTLNSNNSPPSVTGTVTATNWAATNLLAYRATTDGSARYTMLLAPTVSGLGGVPPGDGYLLMSQRAGVLTLSGDLADGTALTQTVPATAGPVGNEVPVYVSLYAKTGVLTGWLAMTNGAPSGNLTWIKQPVKSGLGMYAEGFTNTLIGQGSGWTNQLSNPAIILTNGQLNITGGTPPLAISWNVSVNDKNAIKLVTTPTNNATNSLTGSINPITGLVTITFGNGDKKATTAGKGVVLQSTTNLGGYFLDKTNAGSIILTTAE